MTQTTCTASVSTWHDDHATGQTAPRHSCFLSRRVLNALTHLRHGRLSLRMGEERLEYGSEAPDGLHAVITVHDRRLFRDIALGGSVGAGDAYLERAWSADDLTAALRLICRNFNAVSSLDGGLARPALMAMRALHWLQRNTRRGSRRNIARHYDLSNEFFELFLDPTLMYSSALFESDTTTLEEASARKLDRVCQELNLGPHDHVMEIGTGWGGFALHAAANYGCRVTTTTISRNQYATAEARIKERRLTDRITLLNRDYRDLGSLGAFDKLVSIEMIEAVGHEFLAGYFSACDRLLRPGGEMLVQAILMPDQRYDGYRKSTDFIRKHVFPGGHLPSVSAMQAAITRGAALQLKRMTTFAESYSRTLREWRARFFARLEDVRRLGFDDRFVRMWEYYLCYCEAAFLEGAVDVGHLVWQKNRY